MIHEIEKLTADLIQKDFDLPEVKMDEQLFQHLRELLIHQLKFLLDHDFEKLIQILYRIDISENKAMAALSNSSDQNFGEALADLIIARQMEKATTRLKFRDAHNKT